MQEISGKNDTTKQKLVKAGIRLFSRYGYTATTTRMIAHEAEVNLSAISFHFGNKECLYSSCLEYMCDKIHSYYEKSHEEIKGVFDRGEMTKGLAYSFLEKLIDLQLEAAFGYQYQTTLALVYQENTGPEGLCPLSTIIFEKQEKVMARLLQFLSPLSDQKAMIASRFINGSIIAFAEHKNLVLPYILKTDKDGAFPPWVRDEIKENCLAIIRRHITSHEE